MKRTLKLMKDGSGVVVAIVFDENILCVCPLTHEELIKWMEDARPQAVCWHAEWLKRNG